MKLEGLGFAFIASALAAGSASAQVTQTYTYDGHGRLVGVSTTGSGGTNTAIYSYDAAHNRTQRVRSGTTSYAALESLPGGRLLAPDEALVSPDGRHTFAMRPSGRLELWREDQALWSLDEMAEGPDVETTAAGSALTLVRTEAAAWSVTDEGTLIATSEDGHATLWSSAAGSL